MKKLLTYAIDEGGQLMHVDSVATGLACDCICPSCGGKLMAKNNGAIRDHHFAHASGIECDGALESAIHLLAKKIIRETKSIMLPLDEYTGRTTLLRFDKVDEEVWLDSIRRRPDLVCTTKDGIEVLVEFKNTHAVDDKKRTAIKKNNLVCIEIDVCGQELDEKQLRVFLNGTGVDRTWISIPKSDEFKIYHTTIDIILQYSIRANDYAVIDTFYNFTEDQSSLTMNIVKMISNHLFRDNWRTVDESLWYYCYGLLWSFKGCDLFRRVFFKDFHIVNLVRKDYYDLGFNGKISFFDMIKELALNDVVDVDNDLARAQKEIIWSLGIINVRSGNVDREKRIVLQLSFFVLLLRIWPDVKSQSQNYVLFEKNKWFIVMCVCLTFNMVLYTSNRTLAQLCENVERYDLKYSHLFVHIAQSVSNKQLMNSEEYRQLEVTSIASSHDPSLDELFIKIFPKFFRY